MRPHRARYSEVVVVVTVVVIGLAAFLVGFYVLPARDAGGTVWERICRAAGVVAPNKLETELKAAHTHSSVVTPRAAMTKGTPDELGRGATLALRCTVCHGAQGMSGADAPNLAGQYSEVIYKQLVDFQRGARSDAVMGAMVATLNDAQMLDLSHYYASLARPTSERSAAAPALVRVGDPLRNIAPCGSCHGRVDGKPGAPALEGQPKAYLEKQLSAFVEGSRQNDVNAVMRNEVRRLTQSDLATLTEHYAQADL